jgi:polysaccharide pyruvyl transferase WcaK-like protein
MQLENSHQIDFPRRENNILSVSETVKLHLIGWHNQGAHGDDLLASVLRSIFEKAAKELKIAAQWVEAPDHADYNIIGGGTLLGVDHIGILDIINECGKPYSIFGTGFRRERRDIGAGNISQLKDLIQGADHVFLRGYTSQQFCIHAGIERSDVIGDPALSFEPLKIQIDKSDKFIVGVSIRHMDSESEPQYTNNDDTSEVITQIINFINNQKKCKFYFFDLAENKYDSDRYAIQKLLNKLPDSLDYEVISFQEGHIKIFSMISKMDYIISQRLHPSVIGWSCDIPHIALDYQNCKTQDFLSTIGMCEFVIRTDDFSMNTYKSMFCRLELERRIISQHASKSISFWKKRQNWAAIKILSNYLTSHFTHSFET